MERTCVLVREQYLYVELPKWFFVAHLETLEVDNWGIKATVLTAFCRIVVSAASIHRRRRMGNLVSHGEAMECVLCRVVDALRRGDCRTTYIPSCGTCPSSPVGANPCFGAFAIGRHAEMPMGNNSIEQCAARTTPRKMSNGLANRESVYSLSAMKGTGG